MSMQTQNKQPFLSAGTLLLLLVVGLFAVVAIYRLIFGIGATTNLTDDVPWGLWVAADIMVGVALAAGGFTIAATVYILNLQQYKSLARPAVLTAFVGYVIVALGVFFDVGKPFSLWHPIFMWQPHSIMFEVVWCVVIYTTVLALEFAPSFLEGIGKESLAKAMRAKSVVIPLVIMAVTLSFLHQSSLGALFLLMKGKLSHLWWSTMLPYNFFLSAVAVGLAMTSFETIVAGRIFRHPVSMKILQGLARGTALALACYAVVRLGDIIVKGNLGLAFAGTRGSMLFLLEIGLGVLLPMVMLFVLSKGGKRDENSILFAQMLVIGGVILNRVDIVYLSQKVEGVTYTPSWMEFALTAGLVAIILVLFRAAMLYLPILKHAELE